MNVAGIEIFVKMIKGQGDIQFLLLHNAGGDHQFFAPQIDLLKPYGDVIQLDLPGHGQSTCLNEASLESIASLMVQLCKQLTLSKICLVGLNYGADLAIEIAQEKSLPIESLILIDPPLFMNSSLISEIEGFIEILDSPNPHHFVQDLVDSLLPKKSDAVKEKARQAFNKANPSFHKAIYKSLIDWDKNAHERVKNVDSPTLCLLTDGHLCSYEELRKKAPHFKIEEIQDSKCWASLENPKQVNEKIKSFIMR